MKKNIYVIIGHGKCGKSSITRALTGVYRSSVIDLALLRSGTLQEPLEIEKIKIRVCPKSCQEANKTPDTLLKDINKSIVKNQLIVLRFESFNGQPEALQYLNKIAVDHNVIEIVFMSRKIAQTYNFQDTNINKIDKCQISAINENASMVRRWWKWL